MPQYQLTEWILFFYIYSFIGWCFESFYVSVFCAHRWVNRGFLTGPVLPIYGSGALVILLATLPFRSHVFLIWLAGMAAATLLEYVTGVAMESIFKVRYWDYSAHRLNFQGQICLSSSIAWGFFSVLLVKFVHLPVEKFVLNLDAQLSQIAVIVLTVLFTCDVTRSVMAALDLRGLLAWVDSVKGELKLIQKRIEVIEAMAADERAQRKKDLLEELDRLRARRDMIKSWVSGRFGSDKKGLLRRNPGALSTRYKEALEKIRDWQNQH